MREDADPDDDWAPLRPEQLIGRPGELEPSAQTALSPVVEPPKPAPPPRPRSRPTPEGERAFAELQQRLLAMPPSDSIMAEMQRREQRAARRRDRKGRVDEQLAGTVLAVGEPSAPAPEPALEFDEPRSELDPRELEPWFLELPASERERLRRTWADKRDRLVDNLQVQRRLANRRTVAALLCFVATIALGSHALWHATLGAGIVCGIWWRHAPPDRLMDPIRAAVCMIGMQCLALVVAGGISPTLGFDCVLLVGMSALVGFDGEIKRSGGFTEA
ncbi:MAG: hypothetical protein H6835_18410 [Planctomycetes bacterium]|nr:hypothetical protein [Planctomycetota bacterium]